MFSLIITVIAIALVTALALATIYYGGAAFKQGQLAARAATVVNQGQQILAAFDLFETTKGRLPDTLPELVPEYLTALPVTAQATPSESYLGVTSAYAAGVPLGDWQLPAPQVATVAILSGVPLELCKEINQRVRGNNGVLLKAYPDATTQCYGLTVDALTIVVTRDGGTLVAGMGAGNVSLTNPPAAADVLSPEWLVPPSGPSTGVSTEPQVALGAPATVTDSADATQNYQTILINVPSNGLKIEAGTDGFIPGTGAVGDTYVRLIDPNGTEVAENDDTANDAQNGGASYLAYPTPNEATGVYELHIGCYAANSCTFTAGYRLTPVVPPPSVSYSASPVLAFGDTTVTTSTGVSVVTVTNTGAAPLAFTATGAIVSEPFFITANSCASATVAPSGTCSIALKFSPTESQAYSADLTLQPTSGSVSSLQLTGNGLAVVLGEMTDVASVTAMEHSTFAIKNDGTLWVTGENQNGQLGTGTTADRNTFVKVMDAVSSVSPGYGATFVLKTDGTLWAAGTSFSNALGTGETSGIQATFVQVLSNVAWAGVPGPASFAIKKDGTLWGVGYNGFGTLGDGTTADVAYFKQIPGVANAASVSYNYGGAYLLKTDATLWTSGDGYAGSLLDGAVSRSTFQQVMSNVAAVTRSGYGAQVLQKDGSLWARGDANGNWWGQVGNGTRSDQNNLVKVLTGVASAVLAGPHNVARKTDGTLWAAGAFWGYGNVGNPGFSQVFSGATWMAAQAYSTVAITSDGRLWSTSTGTNYPLDVLRPVLAGVSKASISGSGIHTAAIKTDGTLWTSGANDRGQLGDGTTAFREGFVPAQRGEPLE